MIRFDGDDMIIRFDQFDAKSYRTFLSIKRLPEYRVESDEDGIAASVIAPARFASMLGIQAPERLASALPMSDRLYDDQHHITRIALDAKRFACWSDCGLGKTVIGLEYARHVCHRTDGRVLIVTLNEIVQQWIDESEKFYGGSLPVARIETRDQMREWCKTGCIDGIPTAGRIAITNYEKFNHKIESDQVVSELRYLAGIVCDESSRLKTGGGKQKWAIIKSSKGIEYKLSLTATPAPNETTEFASQASFLEKMRSDNDIIWTYFTRDPKTHRWTVKKHARAAFFEFMAGWSIYVRDPRKYGWRKNVEVPPEPETFVHSLPCSDEQRDLIRLVNVDESGTGSLFASRELNAIQTNKLSQAAKGFIYAKGEKSREINRIASAKPDFVFDLIRQEAAANLQVLVWTVYDAESSILSDMLRTTFGISHHIKHSVLTGATKDVDRIATLESFRRGECRVLISRASMLGYGMNFQMCGSMIFSGWTFSYESYYQAVRRAYRHGQTKRLRVHIPVIPELEGQMYDAICHKQSQHEGAIEEMEQNYIRAMKAIRGTKECAA